MSRWGFVRLGRRAVTAAVASLVLACGSDAPARRPAPPKPKVVAAPIAQPAPAPPPPRSTVAIKGLTGTLNKDDVHQTMEAQQPAFDQCIDASRRSVRWISGTIRFKFKVDAEGRVAAVHPTESTIGHRALEQCLGDAVAATVFPKPAGRAAATFDWDMTVEPVPGPPIEPLEPKILAKVLRKQRREIVRTCEIRRRERFLVTAYVARTGRIVSAGAVPMPPAASEKLDCVLGEIAGWRMPKVHHRSKISFLLR